MEAAGLEPEPFDVPLHLGPGMPAHGPLDPYGATGRATGQTPAESEATGSVSA